MFDRPRHLGDRMPKVHTASYLVSGMVALAGGLISYFYVFHEGGISKDSQDWADFGSYLGGFVGPCLSFIAVVLIARAVRLQTIELSDARKASREQTDFLQEQIKLMRVEQRQRRLESMAETARNTIERRMESPVTGFSHANLRVLVEEVAGRTAMRQMCGKPITLVQALEAERQGTEVLDPIPTAAKFKAMISPVAAIDNLPRLAWAIEDYCRCVWQLASADDLEERDVDSYIRSKIQPFHGIALKLFSLGVVDETALRQMGLEHSLLVKGGVSVLRDPKLDEQNPVA